MVLSSLWSSGSVLGHRFVDVRLIHAGSRFTLYEARELATDRVVAIKVPDASSAAWLNLVLDHEAAVLAAIGNHPHVVTLFQRITLDDRRPALLLERCARSLEDAVQGGAVLQYAEASAVGIKIAGALETAHTAGYVHRDVRPRNILITQWGEPVLSGFDESVQLGADTAYGPLHVTTAHTAPELLEGQAATAASDVYGLASTMYELIAGRAAFRAYAGESPAAVIVRVLSNTVRPIIAPDVPLELSDLLTWGMAANPADRPPSPAWLAEELARIAGRHTWPRTRMTVA